MHLANLSHSCLNCSVHKIGTARMYSKYSKHQFAVLEMQDDSMQALLKPIYRPHQEELLSKDGCSKWLFGEPDGVLLSSDQIDAR